MSTKQCAATNLTSRQSPPNAKLHEPPPPAATHKTKKKNPSHPTHKLATKEPPSSFPTTTSWNRLRMTNLTLIKANVHESLKKKGKTPTYQRTVATVRTTKLFKPTQEHQPCAHKRFTSWEQEREEKSTEINFGEFGKGIP